MVCATLCSTVAFAAKDDELYMGRVIDNAEILTSDEEEKLLKKAEKLSDKHDMDITILTELDVPMESAYSFLGGVYDDVLDTSKTNIILFVGFDDEGRYAQVDIFNDFDTKISTSELVKIREAMQSGSESKSYYDRLDKGLSTASIRAKVSESADAVLLGFFPISFIWMIGGAIVSGIILIILIGKHNKANKKTTASVYLDSGSITVIDKRDRYVRTDHQVKHGYYKKSSSGGGGGGGGHRSSGGGRF